MSYELEVGCFYWLYAKDTEHNRRRGFSVNESNIGKFEGESKFVNGMYLFSVCGTNTSEDLDDWDLGAKVG